MKIFSGYIFSSKSSGDAVTSEPPEGYRKVTGVYIEPQTGALIIIYEEE